MRCERRGEIAKGKGRVAASKMTGWIRLVILAYLAYSEYKHSLNFHVQAMLKTRAPIANPPNSAKLGGPPTIPQVTSGSVQ